MERSFFQFDYDEQTQAVKKYWQFCVGSGHAALAQRADYQEQLKLVHDALGMERVRFHGTFNDDMNVCLRPGDFLPSARRNHTKIYSFYQIGKLYDRLLEIGVRPFVELSFMPSALASGRKTVFSYKGNVTLPKSMGEWQEFIRAFARFLLGRYGAQEVRSWYFEVWNEPDLACFFKGSMEDYYRLYAATARALKSVDPHLMVGGPATTRSSHLPEFLSYCEQNAVPVDFLSTHQYPTDALGHSIHKERLKQLKRMRTAANAQSLSAVLQPVFDNGNAVTPELKGYMTREMRKAREQAGKLPLFYTEWSISSNCVAAIHDGPRAAAFLVKTVLDAQGMVDGSSYWTFSDIFEELFFFPEPFSGGFGLLTADGIPKPAFWAFQLLSQLPDTRYALPVTDADVELAAFRAADGSVCLMLYAQRFESDGCAYDTEIEIDHAPAFRSAKAVRVNSVSGNPFALWRAMGSLPSLTGEEARRIRSSTQPKEEQLVLEQQSGRMCLHISIEDNEVIFITLQR